MQQRDELLKKLQELDGTLSKLHEVFESLKAKKEANSSQVEKLTHLKTAFTDHIEVLEELCEVQKVLGAWCKERGGLKSMTADDLKTY